MNDNKRILAAINEVCTPDSLLIIDKKGRLRRLYCPFKVITIYSFSFYSKNTLVEVVAVKVTPDLLLVYVIGQVAYPYYLFKIIL
jgi:hypothetical protein